MTELLDFLSFDAFSRIVAVTSIFAAVLSLLAVILSAAWASQAVKAKLEAAEETRFQQIVESNRLEVLGKYLDDTIGKFTVNEYANNSTVAVRVDRLLARVREYVGSYDDVSAEEPLEEVPETAPDDRELPPEFAPIIEELRTGETWNALARLRRHIETSLREIAIQSGISEQHTKSAGHMTRLLMQRDVLSPSLAKMLRYAIDVSNRAVHGIDVSIDQAEEAIEIAARVLKDISTSKT